MSLSVIADVHLANHARFGGLVRRGVNQRAQHILDVLDAAVLAAPPGDLFVLGDLFDVAKPEPSLIAAAQAIFSQRSDLTVRLLVGNHDQTSESPGNHAMAPLAPVAEVYEVPTYLHPDKERPAVLVVPFAAPMAPALDEAVLTHAHLLKERPWVLLGHWGIAADDSPAYLRDGRDVVTLSRLEQIGEEFPTLLGVAAGNWHTRWKQHRVLQVGALAPTGWDNPGPTGYGTLATWDGAGWKTQELPGPRFVTSAADAERVTKAGGVPYLRLRGEAAPEGLKVAGLVVEAGDDAEVTAAARTAAAAARSADTLEGALRAFVEGMSVPEGVSKADVLAKARGFLAGKVGG